MRILIVAAAAFSLNGCAEYYQRVAAEQASSADSECQSYGFKLGSEAYANCRMNAANRQAAADAERLRLFQAQQAQQQQDHDRMIRSWPGLGPKVNTTCQTNGTTTNCQSQ